VVAGHPHHVTQRGLRRLETFFEPGGLPELSWACQIVLQHGSTRSPSYAMLQITAHRIASQQRFVAIPVSAKMSHGIRGFESHIA
jgi:hypothetical protein